MKQEQLKKNQTYFEKVQNKINQEKIDEVSKEYLKILEETKKEIEAKNNKLGFVDKKQP